MLTSVYHALQERTSQPVIMPLAPTLSALTSFVRRMNTLLTTSALPVETQLQTVPETMPQALTLTATVSALSTNTLSLDTASRALPELSELRAMTSTEAKQNARPSTAE